MAASKADKTPDLKARIATITATWGNNGDQVARQDDRMDCTWSLHRQKLDQAQDEFDEHDNEPDMPQEEFDDDSRTIKNGHHIDKPSAKGRCAQDGVRNITGFTSYNLTSRWIDEHSDLGMSEDDQSERLRGRQASKAREADTDDWAQDLYSMLSQTEFKTWGDEEEAALNAHALTSRATAASTRSGSTTPRQNRPIETGRGRSSSLSSVITVLQVNQQGIKWELDERQRVVWLPQAMPTRVVDTSSG